MMKCTRCLATVRLSHYARSCFEKEEPLICDHRDRAYVARHSENLQLIMGCLIKSPLIFFKKKLAVQRESNQLLDYQSSSAFFPCIAACLCLSASARPPAILPLLSRAPTSLPLYPLSLAESPFPATGLRPAGRLAGGAGGFGFPFAGLAGAGGGGGGAGDRCTTSSRYADGAHPEADLSSREASHQPSALSASHRR